MGIKDSMSGRFENTPVTLWVAVAAAVAVCGILVTELTRHNAMDKRVTVLEIAAVRQEKTIDRIEAMDRLTIEECTKIVAKRMRAELAEDWACSCQWTSHGKTMCELVESR